MNNDEVDSINFKNAIINSIFVELPEFGKDIKEMIIEEDYGNDYFGNLVIQNYPNLTKIVVKKNSLMNLISLKICNCEKLKIIEIEDGEFWDARNIDLGSGAFYNVKNVIIESNRSSLFFNYIFLICNHSNQDIIHSIIQEAYHYRVIL